jgi:hypothetical protein
MSRVEKAVDTFADEAEALFESLRLGAVDAVEKLSALHASTITELSACRAAETEEAQRLSAERTAFLDSVAERERQNAIRQTSITLCIGGHNFTTSCP